MEADVCAVILWIGVMLYAVLGGADFGAGFWELAAGGAERGRRPRELIDRAVAPVWEMNHVWLIFVFVTLWTAFPPAFSAILSTLFIPFSLAALGIVLRGASFAFREVSTDPRARASYGVIFAVSSILTPFFLGAALGGVASGRVPPGNAAGDIVTSWANPTSAMVGALAVATCAYLAGVYLLAEARRSRDAELTRYFRQRVLASGTVAGLLAVAGLVVLDADADYVSGRLLGEALPLVILSAMLGIAVLLLVARRRYVLTRFLAAGAVASVIWAWGVAQWDFLLPETLTIAEGAGDEQTLLWVIVVFAVALVTVVPAIGLLLYLDQRGELALPDAPVRPDAEGRMDDPPDG